MNATLNIEAINIHTEQDHRISETVEREQARLRNFIRQRVSDPGDAEDILQDVFFELVVAYRLLKPVRQAGAWLFQVARNRITDRFRKKKPVTFSDVESVEEDGELLDLEEILPSPDSGPEAEMARSFVIQEIEEALGELPEEQREIFIAHEIEGRSFKDLSAETGVSINTLLSRKRYAVLHLQERLQLIYDEFMKG